MKPSERRSRFAGVALSLVGLAAVAGLALSHSSPVLAPTVALAGIAGIVTFAAALERRRNRTVAIGLVLVGIAAVLGTLHDAAAARGTVLALSGAVLFSAAEIADRSLDQGRHLEHRPGVRRWSPGWILGVAAAAGAVSYGAVALRGVLAGGGPAALAAGTVAAVLVAILTAALVRNRVRAGW